MFPKELPSQNFYDVYVRAVWGGDPTGVLARVCDSCECVCTRVRVCVWECFSFEKSRSSMDFGLCYCDLDPLIVMTPPSLSWRLTGTDKRTTLDMQERERHTHTHRGRKHWAFRPQKPLRLIRDGEVGGSGVLYLTPTLSPPEWFGIKVGSCVSHFNVSLIVWAKSQDSVHNHNFTREEKGESKRIEPKSFCLPAKRLIDRPHRLKSQKHRAVLIYATGEGIQLCSSRALLHSVPFKPIE